jgi:hypothetical protein
MQIILHNVFINVQVQGKLSTSFVLELDRFYYSVTKTVLKCLNWYSGGRSPIGSTRYCDHQWPIVPTLGDYDDGEIGGMICRGNRSTRSKPAPVPLCPPQTPHAARTLNRAVAVGSQRLTT